MRDRVLLICSWRVFLEIDIGPAIEKNLTMLIIQWLKRLPASHGILVCGRTATKCDTTEDVGVEAQALWANSSALLGTAHPDGFQVVDQDGRSICGACYILDGATNVIGSSKSEGTGS